jgi:hypothetical protein
MSLVLAKALVVLLLAGALMTVPLGLPGVWIMVAILGGALLAGWVSWPVWLALAALTGLAEILEFVILKRMGDRFGGGQGAFWGAVVGGLVGVLVGMPIPVLGPVLAGLVGTFAGAAAVTLAETRSLGRASRVGWGVLLARILAVALKVGVGMAVLAVGGGAVILG